MPHNYSIGLNAGVGWGGGTEWDLVTLTEQQMLESFRLCSSVETLETSLITDLCRISVSLALSVR